MNKEIMKRLFPEEEARVDREQCPFCGHDVKLNDFRDGLSFREFRISGLCQACQDKTFKEPEE